jgi:hypothetical protein
MKVLKGIGNTTTLLFSLNGLKEYMNILVEQHFRNSIRDVKTLPAAGIDSDYNILVAELQIRLKSSIKLGSGNQNEIWKKPGVKKIMLNK